MAQFYTMRIRMEKMELSEVPQKWRTAVESLLGA